MFARGYKTLLLKDDNQRGGVTCRSLACFPRPSASSPRLGGGSDTASRATYLSLSEGNGPRQLGPALVRGSCVSLCLSCFVRETDFGDLDLLCAVKRLPSFQIRRVVSLL